MCDPVSIATIGAAVVGEAGSIFANQSAASSVDSARAQAIRAENERQQKLRTEGQAFVDDSEGDFQNLPEEQKGKEAELTNFFQGARGSTETPTNVAPQASNPLVASTETQQKGKARKFVGQQGKALAKMRGFGDALSEANIGLAQNAGKVGQVAGFQQGSANVLPLELEAANHQGEQQRFIGDMLSGVSAIATPFALGGGGAPGLVHPPGSPIGVPLPGRKPMFNPFAAY